MKRRLAKIRWLKPQEGGRSQLPRVESLRSVSRFDVDPNYKLGTWDLIIKFKKLPTARSLSIQAEIAFASEDAPAQLLRVGSRFELAEGKKTVARGVVIE